VSARAVVRAASGGALRRVVPSLVVLAVLALSTAAALLALAILTSANQGFYDAFAAQHEAQLQITINQAKVSSAQLAKTRSLPGVTRTAGPYPTATITARPSGAGSGPIAPGSSFKFTVVGRSSPSGALHRIQYNSTIMDGFTHGQSRWPSRTGEISLAQTTPIRVRIGGTVTVTNAPGRPKLQVVGYGSQTVYYDGGWVLPSEIPLLRRPGAPSQEEMFYNFQSANTNAQMGADLRQLKRALGPGAIAGSQSDLVAQQGTSQEQSWNTPFITAFVIIALVLAVLIVANVVAAAVLASQRRIGVLKSIGFTPRQVTAVYLTQIGAPALVGATIGAVLGNHWALPLIETAPTAISVTVPTWIDLTAPLAMLTLSGVAAAVPALRAGRMSTVQAITGGQAPPAGRGYLAHRLVSRLPLPRPVTLGLSAPFSRPTRSAMTLVSITAGLTAAVMAIGLNNSIDKINNASTQGLGQVQVQPSGVRDAPLTPRQDTAVASALQAQPGARHHIAESDAADGVMARSASQGVLVPNPAPNSFHFKQPPPGTVVVRIRGPLNPVNVIAYNGQPSWLGWALIAGRWYRGDEIDATPDLLADVHKRVGQSIAMTVNGTPITVRIAGEAFTPNPGPTLFVSWETLGHTAAATLASEVTSYDINLKPGITTNSYINALTRRLGTTSYIVRTPAGPSIAFNIQPSYFHRLALLVAVLAALGVLNSVLMATRERLHDLGIYKALGMTPRQIIAMVLCWVIAPTIIAATVALPVGLIVQDRLIVHLAAVTGPLILPGSFVHVLGPGELALLTLAALTIAAAGALGPASWAAASKATTALRAE